MVFELHVWGPAFSLPSIDAQCLAAIAYLTQTVPRSQWKLIASSDPALSPTNELPALRNGITWIGGFRNIADYLRQYSDGEWALDQDLDDKAKADCAAFSSFVESQGQPLLDLSLYVSTQNYTNITRPIYNTIQSFPRPYVTPPAVRAAAKNRTEYLGLSSLDIDSEDVNPTNNKSIIPESLRLPRQTVTSLLAAAPENKAQIRLDSLASNFFTPLQGLRSSKRFFLSSSEPSSLDCLAFGYLSLCLLPDLPQPWLARTMRQKFPQLCAFVHELQRSFFGGPCSVVDAFHIKYNSADKGNLPWSKPEAGGLLAIGGVMAAGIVDSIPGVAAWRRITRLQEMPEEEMDDEVELELARAQYQRKELLTTIGSVAAGVVLLVGFLFHQGFIALHADDSSVLEQEQKQVFVDDEDDSNLADVLSEMGDLNIQNDLARAFGGFPASSNDSESGIGVDVDVAVAPDETVRDRVV